MLKGIVFDLDGTLVDSLSVTFDAFNYAIEKCGSKRLTPHEILRYFGTGEVQIFEKILGSKHAQAAYSANREYLDQNMSQVPLHNGIRELLEKIENSLIPVSIFTGRSWPTTEMILRHHGILDRFITIVASDHVNFSKPSPDGLILAADRMGLRGSEVLMIGDNPADILAAKGAGAQSVAALWDWMADRESMEKHGPDHWAENPERVWQIWERVNAIHLST